ncbi:MULTISPECIES: LysR family transcriptional regulator [Corallococcus]|uniref:LysR family transcriptional regulator n=1 Tax=Corallococcus TaxID=83461 RepID=UPI00117ECD22|nr:MULTISPECIES: LysR family transcriptional regulator [Corallococcus]NBD08302.1 LysR family transcriptional regulator [Corallococcus silvisoli]TSC34263.1 LysR family transcriptional regulator [Corallococcus sp. Z5C101001]
MLTENALAGIRAFVALGDTGSFTDAAQRIDVSRTAVSKAVSRLEARLGVRLVERSTRRLALTPEGREFHERCRQVMEALASAEASVSTRRTQPAGDVRLDVPLLFGRRWVMPVVGELAARHPRLRFDVTFSNRVSELVADGVDLAVRIGKLADRAELMARPLGVQRTILCASPTYLARGGVPQTLADLAGHRCLLSDRRTGWRLTELVDATRPEAGMASSEVPVDGALCLRDTGALLDAALAGMGVAQLPSWLAAEHLQAGALRRVLPMLRGASLPIHAVWPRGRHMPPRIRLVIDALVAQMATQPQFAA